MTDIRSERERSNLEALDNLPTLLRGPFAKGLLETYVWIDSYCVGCQQRHLPARQHTHGMEDGKVCGPISLVYKEFTLTVSEAQQAVLDKEALIDLRQEKAKEIVNQEMHRMDINADYFANVREKFKVHLEGVVAANKEISRGEPSLQW